MCLISAMEVGHGTVPEFMAPPWFSTMCISCASMLGHCIREVQAYCLSRLRCWAQAIERRGTSISYGQLLYSMSEALEQLSAQQGKLPPKLPAQVGGLFGGLVNKLVSSEPPPPSVDVNRSALEQHAPSRSWLASLTSDASRCPLRATSSPSVIRERQNYSSHRSSSDVLVLDLQMDGAMDMAGLSAQTPVLSCNYPFDLNRPLAI